MKNIITGARWFGLGILSLSVGCYWNCDVDRFADIPPGAIPEPPQTTVHRHFETQSAKAEADDFVFYRHEFFMDGKELGPYGQYHLRLVANRIHTVPFPILVQAMPDPKLNEARRQTVILGLKRIGLDDIDQRVIVGFPEAEGMSGEEAERVNASLPQAGTGVNGNNLRNNGIFGNNNFFNNGFGSQRAGRNGFFPFF
jgi:hypothetical protein